MTAEDTITRWLVAQQFGPTGEDNSYADDLLAALSAAGFAVVPVEMTDEMRDASMTFMDYSELQPARPDECWAAMLAAARREG